MEELGNRTGSNGEQHLTNRLIVIGPIAFILGLLLYTVIHIAFTAPGFVMTPADTAAQIATLVALWCGGFGTLIGVARILVRRKAAVTAKQSEGNGQQ